MGFLGNLISNESSMASCKYCGLTKFSSKGCIGQPFEFNDGKTIKPLKYGEDRNYEILHTACPGCGCHKGYYHHPGCNQEVCPVCGKQAISCHCESGSSKQATSYHWESVAKPLPDPEKKAFIHKCIIGTITVVLTLATITIFTSVIPLAILLNDKFSSNSYVLAILSVLGGLLVCLCILLGYIS